jgi:hypothetical protein
MDIKKNQNNLFLAMKGLATHTNEQFKAFQATTRKWIDTRTKSCAPDPTIPTQSGINTPASIQMRYIKCLQMNLEGKMDKSQVTSAVTERLDPVMIDQQELRKRLADIELVASTHTRLVSPHSHSFSVYTGILAWKLRCRCASAGSGLQHLTGLTV